jgi:integrase
MEEAGGLRLEDVREEDGMHFFNFMPTAERRLKRSRRKVPIHPHLIRLGLLDYMQGVPQDGLLFPELKPGPHGKLTGALSKWWARFNDAHGVTDPLKVFHSFRHTFVDACRRVGISEEQHNALTGHSNGSVSRRYGSGVALKTLAECMEKVSYPGLDLSHLQGDAR